jgi:N,N-dimethylformamidase beta subunit-like, C-terminal
VTASRASSGTKPTAPATPSGTLVLAHSPVTDVNGRSDFQEAAVRDLPGGAFVFAAGTIEWSWGLSKPGIVDARVQRITENVFRRAGLTPASSP